MIDEILLWVMAFCAFCALFACIVTAFILLFNARFQVVPRWHRCGLAFISGGCGLLAHAAWYEILIGQPIDGELLMGAEIVVLGVALLCLAAIHNYRKGIKS